MSLEELKKQIPYKWRVQSFSKTSQTATCVAYVDARDVMDILDEVVGIENWQSDYKDQTHSIESFNFIPTPAYKLPFISL